MILDFHTHLFPDAIADAAVSKLASLSHTPPFLRGTAEALRCSCRKAGIDACVVLPVATNPAKLASLNRVSLEQNGKDGLFFFGAVHPLSEDAFSQLEALAAAGIRGIKLHPVYQGVDADALPTLRILDRAGELGLYTLFHAGDDIGFPGAEHSSPKKLLSACRQVGGERVILAHMGGWKRWEEAEALAECGPYLDTSFSLGEIPGEYYSPSERLLLSQEAFCRMVRLFGARRILFGTDSPWTHQKKSLDAIRSLPLSPEEKDAVLGENARRILGI